MVIKLTIFFAVLFLTTCATQEQSQRFALVYGISDYPYIGLDLPYCSNDAVSVSRLLTRAGYEVKCRTDKEVTLYNARQDFIDLSAKMNSRDVCFFYFSGHGINKGNIVAIGDTVMNEDYFTLLFHNKNIPTKMLHYIYNSAASIDTLEKWFDMLQGYKIVVVDACYSGNIISSNTMIDKTPDDYIGKPDKISTSKIFSDAINHYFDKKIYSKLRKSLILSSSGKKEVSWDGFFSHSVFTYFFLHSGQDGDIDKDRSITLLESYFYTYNAMNKYWNSAEKDADWNFLPHISGSAVDIVIFDKPVIVDSFIVNYQ